MPEVLAVGCLGYRLPSVETETYFDIRRWHLPVLPREAGEHLPGLGNKVSTALVPPFLDEALVQFYRARFSQRAKVTILKRGDRFLKLQVDGLRGEVLPALKVWERIEVYFVFFKDNDRTALHSAFDGYYAPGVGSRPPKEFLDMSSTYHKELSDFASRMTEELWACPQS